MNTNVPRDVYVIHFLSLARFKKINDVEILEVAADVVREINATGWEAARCSPMSGMTLQRPQSKQQTRDMC